MYIGQLEAPLRQISDDDNDRAHLDEDNPKLIHFKFVSKGHEFMDDKVLKVNEGLSHDVFKEVEQAPVENEVYDEEGDG